MDYSKEKKDGQSNHEVQGNSGLDGAKKAPSDGMASPEKSTTPSAPIKNSDEIDLDLDMDDDADGPILAPPTKSTSEQTSASPPTKLIEEESSAAPSIELSTQTPPTDHKPSSTTSSVPDALRARLPASFTRPTAPPSGPPHQPEQLPHPPTITNKITNFLALDKCLPHRKFLQILDISPLNPSDPPSPPRLTYDPEWLSILRAFGDSDPHSHSPPNLGEAAYMPLIAKEREWVDKNLVESDRLKVPKNFEMTAPAYNGGDIRYVGRQQPKEYSNPQTKAFCEMLGIRNWFDASGEERAEVRRKKEELIQAAGGGERHSGGSGRGRGGGGRGGGGRGGGGRGRGKGRP